MNTKVLVLGVGVLALMAILGWFIFNQSSQNTLQQNIYTDNNTVNNTDNPNPQNDSNQNGLDIGVEVGISQNHEVRYTNSGYSPNMLTIKLGDTVTFKNESSSAVWTASAMHPGHSVYAGTTLQQHCPDQGHLAFDQCQNGAPGTSWSFTFNKKGEWGYHNHSNASHFGRIVVE